ncbi:MAG: FAD-dependent oxidoreductase, partial [Acidobacteriota bacterium]|nr:FAD-dependent oxidoreductase [Acidobacteriota bacterium]
MANGYDVIVIGAGTGGYVAAIRASQLGLTVAVVERQTALGGTCLIWGCIPTKALLEHAHALKVAQGAAEWGLTGVDGKAVGIDMPAVHARKDKMIAGLTGGIEMLFRKNKVDWIKGTARLAGGLAVEVTLHDGAKRSLIASKEIIVATGSAPRSVPGIDVDRSRIIFSDEAIHLPAVPKTIAILGSGAVGVEFASIFRSFGSEVTIIELLPRLVPGEDEGVSAELQRTFKKRGITVHTGTKVIGAKASADSVALEMQGDEGKAREASFDTVLVATGRGPVTDGLGAEALGLRMDRGYIVVDELFRTSVPGVSAIGDVITMGGPHYQLAHVSSMEGVLLAERIAGV